jgi:hypothetical protein
MRRFATVLLTAAVAASPALAVGAPQRSVSADAKAAGVTIKHDAKAFGFAVKHTAIQIGHAAKRFGLRVASATKQGVHDYRARADRGNPPPAKRP